MKKKINLKLFLIASVIALIVAFTCAMPMTALAEDKEAFDTSLLGYESKTVVYDGKEHYIEINGSALPTGSVVKFNTIEKEPGVYEAHADIYVGEKYEPSTVTVTATLTILATELADDEGKGSLIVKNGIDPTVTFDLGESSFDFESKLAKGDKLYASYSTSVNKGGSVVALEQGEYEIRVKREYGYSGVKAYVNENGTVTEKAVTFSGEYACFTVSEKVTDVALTYTKKVNLHGEQGNPWLWVQIVLGVVVAGEALTIVLQALKLKKM